MRIGQLRSGANELRDTPVDSTGRRKHTLSGGAGTPVSRNGGGDGQSDPLLDGVSGPLRQAYQSTLDEAIPQSMLDLLSQLD